MARTLPLIGARRFPLTDGRVFPIIAGGGGGGGGGGPTDPHWANVVFLSTFNGVDEATSAVDLSDSAHPITFHDGAKLDTAIKKFGTAALIVDGVNDHVDMPDHDDWHFGTGHFTIEGHYYFPSGMGGFDHLMGQWTGGAGGLSFGFFQRWSSAQINLYISTNGSAATLAIFVAWTPTVDTWYHYAVDFDGTNYRIYVDGVVKKTTAVTYDLYNSTATMSLGTATDHTNDFNGHMDNVRITKGVARYGSGGFTPPTEEYPTS